MREGAQVVWAKPALTAQLIRGFLHLVLGHLT
jgi:hypothetical protein